MEIIWHGTASVEIRCSMGRLLFDPFLPLPGAQVPAAAEEFDGFEAVFVTHGHFDHIASLPEIARRNPGLLIYCTKTPYAALRRRGIPAQNLQCIAFGQKIRTQGFAVTAFHGRHAVLPRASMHRLLYMLSSPLRTNLPYILRENARCRERGETLLYTIEAEGKRAVVMGSLNLREEEAYPQCPDLLILPYNGWEDNFAPAVRVIERLQPGRILLDHYDDAFPPVTMPVDLDPILKRYRGRIGALKKGKAERL